jgi:tRNA modification GTPase
LLAWQEAVIEFEEEDLPTGLDEEIGRGGAALRADIATHLARGGRSEKLREGLQFAILGAPNAGKSSLLNLLAQRDVAIVSARAGTTRDVVEVALNLEGVPVTLCDTAGLREHADEIEAEGIRRALHRAECADLLVAVFAADNDPDPATLDLLGKSRLQSAAERRAVVVVNKCDLAPPPRALLDKGALEVSAVTGRGLDALTERLKSEAVSQAGLTTEAGLTRHRHRSALVEVVRWLEIFSSHDLPEMRAEALRAGIRDLGRITGRIGVEEVLDSVFKEFCIGK